MWCCVCAWLQTTTALKELLLYTVPAPKQTAASAAAAAASAASQMAGALNQSTAAAVPKAVETISSPKRCELPRSLVAQASQLTRCLL